MLNVKCEMYLLSPDKPEGLKILLTPGKVLQ